MAVGRLVFILIFFWTTVADDSANVTNETELQVLDKAEQLPIYSDDEKVQVAAEALAALNAANAIREGKDEAMKDLADIKESVMRHHQQMLQSQLQTDQQQAHVQQAQWSSHQMPPPHLMQQPQYVGQATGGAGQGGQWQWSSQWGSQQPPQPHQMQQAPWPQATTSSGESGHQSQFSSQQRPPPHQMQQPQYEGQATGGTGQGGQQAESSWHWSSQQLPQPYQTQQPQYTGQATGGTGQGGQQAELSWHWSSQQLPQPYHTHQPQYTGQATGGTGQSQQPQQMQQAPSGERATGSSGETGHQLQWSSQQLPPPHQMQQPQNGGQATAGTGQGGQQPQSSWQWSSQGARQQLPQPHQMQQAPWSQETIITGHSAQQQSGQLDSSFQLPLSSYLTQSPGLAKMQQPSHCYFYDQQNNHAQLQQNQAYLQSQQQAQAWQKSHKEMIDRASKQAEAIYQAAPPSVRRCKVDAQVLHDVSYLH